MERPIIMLNTDNMPVFCRNQCEIQNAQSTFQKPMSAAVHVQCGY